MKVPPVYSVDLCYMDCIGFVHCKKYSLPAECIVYMCLLYTVQVYSAYRFLLHALAVLTL